MQAVRLDAQCSCRYSLPATPLPLQHTPTHLLRRDLQVLEFVLQVHDSQGTRSPMGWRVVGLSTDWALSLPRAPPSDLDTLCFALLFNGTTYLHAVNITKTICFDVDEATDFSVCRTHR